MEMNGSMSKIVLILNGFSAGSYVDMFEKEVAKFTKAGFGVSCVNGTSALQVCLRLSGVSPGDEVIIPSLTFIAPVNAISYMELSLFLWTRMIIIILILKNN